MGATMRRETRGDNEEIHVSTGKISPEGSMHVPMWGDWFSNAPIGNMRYCQHPHCDLEDLEVWHAGEEG